MKAEESARLLTGLLEERGVEWTEEGGYVRFRVRREGMCWEEDCLCTGRHILICGRYPFQTRQEALALCNEANLRLPRGAMILPEDGRPVFRVSVETDDPYDAAYRLKKGLTYNMDTVARYWGRFARYQKGDDLL